MNDNRRMIESALENGTTDKGTDDLVKTETVSRDFMKDVEDSFARIFDESVA